MRANKSTFKPTTIDQLEAREAPAMTVPGFTHITVPPLSLHPTQPYLFAATPTSFRPINTPTVPPLSLHPTQPYLFGSNSANAFTNFASRNGFSAGNGLTPANAYGFAMPGNLTGPVGSHSTGASTGIFYGRGNSTMY